MVNLLAKLASATSKALPGMGLVLMVATFLVGLATGNWSLDGRYLLIVVVCCVAADRIGKLCYTPWYNKRYGPNGTKDLPRPNGTKDLPPWRPRWRPRKEPLDAARNTFVKEIFTDINPPVADYNDAVER